MNNTEWIQFPTIGGMYWKKGGVIISDYDLVWAYNYDKYRDEFNETFRKGELKYLTIAPNSPAYTYRPPNKDYGIVIVSPEPKESRFTEWYDRQSFETIFLVAISPMICLAMTIIVLALLLG